MIRGRSCRDFSICGCREAAPDHVCISPVHTSLCGPDLPNATPCPQLLPCQSWPGVAQALTGRRAEPPTPARPRGSGPALCQRERLLTFSKGGPGTPACDHLHPCQGAELWVRPGAPGSDPWGWCPETPWEYTHVPCVHLSRLMSQHTLYIQHNAAKRAI